MFKSLRSPDAIGSCQQPQELPGLRSGSTRMGRTGANRRRHAFTVSSLSAAIREIRGSFSRIVLRLLRCIAANSSFVPPLPATPGRRARYPLSTLHHPSASVAPFCTFLHLPEPFWGRTRAARTEPTPVSIITTVPLRARSSAPRVPRRRERPSRRSDDLGSASSAAAP
jgi:hypothetical protein